jgi:NAD(P)-dependent dehydrogenase (short-subunit alcohol dehydrogenase family)
MRKRACLLTGASGAFGTAFIRRYADRYNIVAVHFRRDVLFATQDQRLIDPLDLARPIAANEYAVRSIRVDLSDSTEIDRLVRELETDDFPIDVLINAAAIHAQAPLLASNALEQAEDTFRVNVLAPLRLSATVGRTIWRRTLDDNLARNRNIVNVSSLAGLAVYPDQEQSVFASSMAALNHLTYHLASELWDMGVRVNAVALDAFPDRTAVDEGVETVMRLDASNATGEIVPSRHAVGGRAESALSREAPQ